MNLFVYKYVLDLLFFFCVLMAGQTLLADELAEAGATLRRTAVSLLAIGLGRAGEGSIPVLTELHRIVVAFYLVCRREIVFDPVNSHHRPRAIRH